MNGLHAAISVVRPDGFRVTADLEIPAGRTTAVLGPNGAGKSSIMEAIAGLVRLDAGLVELSGRVLEDSGAGVFVPPEERDLGIVFQGLLLFENLDVVGNVSFGPRSRGSSRRAAEDRARDWLGRLGIEALAVRRPAELSGGQAQLVALARALASEPSMLLLDEPLASLDVTARARVRRALDQHLSAFAGPRMLITHDPTEAFLLADQIVVIENGEVTQAGPVDDIRLRPRTRYGADLAGVNLLHGVADGGVVDVDGHRLHIADLDLAGPVVATVHPAAIAVHRDRPGGSPRNAWATTIERVEALGNRVRLLTGAPVSLAIEVTESARADLGLGVGSQVWVAIKATEIRVEPDSTGG